MDRHFTYSEIAQGKRQHVSTSGSDSESDSELRIEDPIEIVISDSDSASPVKKNPVIVIESDSSPINTICTRAKMILLGPATNNNNDNNKQQSQINNMPSKSHIIGKSKLHVKNERKQGDSDFNDYENDDNDDDEEEELDSDDEHSIESERPHHYEDDSTLPVYRWGLTRGMDTLEIAKNILNFNDSSTKAATTVPLSVSKNVAFIVNMDFIGPIENLRADDLGRRGREGQRQLKPSSFKFEVDPSGRKFATMTHDELTKNHAGGVGDVSSTEKYARMYETEDVNDGYKVLELYISKLNPKCDSLFQYPRRNWSVDDSDNVWSYANVVRLRPINSSIINLSYKPRSSTNIVRLPSIFSYIINLSYQPRSSTNVVRLPSIFSYIINLSYQPRSSTIAVRPNISSIINQPQ
ncbi:hypothetical protein QZH41_019305, partial [Actinostola sp. cb2023]